MVGGQRGGIVIPGDDPYKEGEGYDFDFKPPSGGGGSGGSGGGSSGPVQGPPTQEEYMEETAPGPRTEEGHYHSRFDKQTYEKHVTGKYYTRQAYEQYWEKQYSKGWDVYHSIDPSQFYMVGDKEVYGHSLRQQIKTEWIDPAGSNLMGAKKLEGYDIIKTRTGFSFKRVEPGPSPGGFASYWLNISDYGYKSLTGDTWKPGQPVESRQMKSSRLGAYYTDVEAWKRGDVGHFALKIASNPYTMALGSYGLGYGLETFKLSSFGQRSLFKIGLFEQKIGSAPKWTYKYTWTATPSGLVETGVGGGFTGATLYGGYDAYSKGRLGEFVTKAGMMFPAVYFPYKWGRISGRTGFQRRAEMSTLKDPVARVRQKAGYDLIDETARLQRTYGFGDVPYDLKNIKAVGGKQADMFASMVDRGGGAFWTGSGPMKAQYRYMFRTGKKPPGTLKTYSESRYSGLGPPKTPTVPQDIDIYFLTKTSSYWKNILKTEGIKGFDVHPYKGYSLFGKELPIGRYSGQYVELGVITQPPVKTTVLVRGTSGAKTIEVWSINPKEQFMRMTRNLLPSKSIEFGHRSIKDMSTWTDTSVMLKQTAHKGWLDAYTRFSFPEHYLSTLKPKGFNKIIKPSLGERIVTRLGVSGKKDINPITRYGKHGYKDFYLPFSYNYPKILTSSGYVSKGYKSPYSISPLPVISQVSKPSRGYKPKSFLTSGYKTPTVGIKKPPYPKPESPISKTIVAPDYKPPKPLVMTPPVPRRLEETWTGLSKRRKEVFDPFGKGYRYRKWDVPSLEDFLKVKI